MKSRFASNSTEIADKHTVPTGVPYRRAYIAVLLERLLIAFWPFLTAAMLVCAIALSGVTAAISVWLHLPILLGSAALLIWSIHTGVRRFTPPVRGQVLHHLERSNRLEHRPLVALQDDLASGEGGESSALWNLHKKRMAAAVQGLDAGGPEARLAGRDRFALRVMAGISLAAVIMAVGARGGENLRTFLQPDFSSKTDVTAAPVTLDAWITPPDYTGAAPIFLTGVDPNESPETIAATAGQAKQVAVPHGSTLVAQVGGVEAAPSLNGLAGRDPEVFENITQGSFRTEIEVSASGLLTVTLQERELARWDVTVTPDTPPEVTLSEVDLGQTQRGSKEMVYTARDDYGVMELSLEIRRTAEPAQDGDTVISVPLPAGGGPRAGDLSGSHFLNQMEHIWAGETVWADLVAVDAIGQTGRSPTLEIVLPEREFRHPMAQLIIAERKRLGLEGLDAAPSVAGGLRELAGRRDLYGGDVVVFLGLGITARRLTSDPTEKKLEEALDLLWDLALRLEDGALSIAEKELRQAEQALMDALARNADAAEIDRLMRELQQAMDQYLQALIQNAQEQLDRGEIEEMPIDESDRMLAQQDINEVMERIREMLQNGMRDAARRMLEQLQRMMENLQVGMQQRPSPQGMEALEMLEGLQELMSGQRELLDRTYDNAREQNMQRGNQRGQQRQGQQGQRGQSGQRGQGQMPADAALQEALRRQLGDLMQRYGEMMGDIPSPFGRAEGEMRNSTEALQQGQSGAAVGPQGRALDQLQEAARQAQQQFMERFGNEMGQGQQALGQGPNTGQQDPFGRAPSDATPGRAEGDVTIPDVGDLQRAREIRDELRRRAGQRTRPEQELDYIERLLKHFE